MYALASAPSVHLNLAITERARPALLARRVRTHCKSTGSGCAKHFSLEQRKSRQSVSQTSQFVCMSSSSAAGDVAPSPSKMDLLIVGPGVLGSYLGKLWKNQHPSSSVLALTNTDSKHAKLSALGLVPATKATLPARRFANVLFAAPPYGNADYPGEVKAAADLWDGSGSLLFTSSTSMYATSDGNATEDSPSVQLGAGPSTDRLLLAEQNVLQAGGSVVRLAGLYHRNRGAHTFFLKAGTVDRPPNYVVSLIHYEDAAGIALAIMNGEGNGGAPHRGKIFLGCDNAPITFEDMMAACTSSGLFSGSVTFTAPPATVARRFNNDKSRALLGGWTPKHASFGSFMASGGADVYCDPASGFQ